MTQEEQARELGASLARYYGPRVQVQYVDIFSPEMTEYPDVMRLVTQRNVPLPLVSINGQPVFAGGISLEMISEELEKLGLVPLEGPGGA